MSADIVTHTLAVGSIVAKTLFTGKHEIFTTAARSGGEGMKSVTPPSMYHLRIRRYTHVRGQETRVRKSNIPRG